MGLARRLAFGFALAIPAGPIAAAGEEAPAKPAAGSAAPIVIRGADAHALGVAHGRALKTEIKDLLDALEPTFAALGDRVSLLASAHAAEARIPREYADEMAGIAEGAGISYESILIENTKFPWPEASADGTSVAGASTTLGQPISLSTSKSSDAAIRDRTTLIVVEPPTGHPFISITWPGMVGTACAMGAQGLSICRAPDEGFFRRPDTITFRNDSTASFGFRDAVQNADTCDAAIRRVLLIAAAPQDLYVLDGHRLTVQGLRDGKPTPPSAEPMRHPTDFRRFEGWQYQGRGNNVCDSVFEPQIGRFHVSMGKDLEPDPATGKVRWITYNLADFLSPTARAKYAPPPKVADTGVFEEGKPLTLGPVVRIPVSFDSPAPSGIPANDRVHATLFLPAGREPVGCVIQLPAWKEHDLLAESIVSIALASRGIAALLFPLPYQVDRAPPGVEPGAWTLSPDLARTREAWMQGCADVLRASLWLEKARGFSPAKQGVFGISLGAHVAACAYGAYPDRFRAGVFVLAGGGLRQLLTSDAPAVKAFRERFDARGVTVEDVEDIVGPLDPARWADPARRDGVFLVGAKGDEIVPAAHVEALSSAYGGAPILWIEGGHYDGIAQAPRILEAVAAHLKRRFGAP